MSQQQKKTKAGVTVAFQGGENSYTHLAAKRIFSWTPQATLNDQGSLSLKDVFQGVQSRQFTYGVVPLESSTRGTIHGVYDKLLASDGQLVIVGEMNVIENYALLGNKSSGNVNDIQEVVSHAQILESCSDYLDFLDRVRTEQQLKPLIRTSVGDSSLACELVAKREQSAAIASPEAAVTYNLKVTKDQVANDLNAETRYIVIAARTETDANVTIDPLGLSHINLSQAGLTSPKANNSNGNNQSAQKMSIVLVMRNIPGALFRVSSCFALRDLNILKMETRPATTAMTLSLTPHASAPSFAKQHWNLLFYIDFTPSPQDHVHQALMNNLNEYCSFVRSFGQYQAASNESIEAQPNDWKNVKEILSIA